MRVGRVCRDIVKKDDPRAGELAPYLCKLYFKIAENCLQKHSK